MENLKYLKFKRNQLKFPVKNLENLYLVDCKANVIVYDNIKNLYISNSKVYNIDVMRISNLFITQED
ncbi:hypothetical protein Catovirus_1_4 [Catovirus CTV1]|uniref:Uncharacterized protein n=1 Tax=Catovirus CTV1 TaxID=1977631 RepID=A0A1V0S8C2_9VIRU|nr:hypothetical protein Catovirus_1_4 [Catovirus CTV1]